jgi:uncharacterized protein with HEPN domain
MSRDPKLRLADIVDACCPVAMYIEGLDTASFAKDLKTQDAVIRQFEIIGEAVKTLSDELMERESSIPRTTKRPR